jgi:hypothetical protein
MRYLILSDIHANCEALTAVLAHVRRKRWDRASSSATWWATAPTPTRPWTW